MYLLCPSSGIRAGGSYCKKLSGVKPRGLLWQMYPRERESSASQAVARKGRPFSKCARTAKLSAFDHSCALATIYYSATSLGGSMENPANLIQRLLEIQSGGRQRSPELIAEDERLIERLRSQAGKSTQTVKLSPDNLSREPGSRQNR
jgi:hypothetical protein